VTILLHKALSYEVRGVLFDVYNALGPLLPERFYQTAVVLGLEKKGTACQTEKQFAVRQIDQTIKNQLKPRMKHLNVTYCLIANFNCTQPETKISNTNYKPK
jgi:hypothetical protein